MKQNKLFSLLISLMVATGSLLGLLWWLEDITLLTHAAPIVSTNNELNEAMVQFSPTNGETNSTDLNLPNHQKLISGTTAYVTISDGNLVALVDTTTHTVTGIIDVGAEICNFPWRAAMSPNGAYVYVSCRYTDRVVVIDTANNTVVRTIYNISNANGIAFTNDGNYALVGSRNSSQVAVINTNTYSLTTYISTYNNPRSVVTHPYFDVAYVTTDAGAVQVIDTTTFSVTSQINFGSQLWDIEVSPDGQWVFVSDRWGAGLAVINANNNTIHTVINNLGDLNGLAVSPDGSQIYANSLWNVVHIIDTNTFTTINTVDIPGAGWELATTCDGSNLYVGNAQSEVIVIDTNTQTVATQITLPNYGTRGIAICPPFKKPSVLLSTEPINYYGTAGETVVYQTTLFNYTGYTDSFNLSLSNNIWNTTLSFTNTGLLADGEAISFTTEVNVPTTAIPGDMDEVIVQATSVNFPTIYTRTNTLLTTVICSPTLSISGQSSQMQGSFDDIYSYGGQEFTKVYINAHTDYINDLNATISAYRPISDTWDIIYEQFNDNGGILVNQYFIPTEYSQIHVELNDNYNRPIYYDYEFVICREANVALNPPAQLKFARPSTTVTYTQTVVNYTFITDTFELNPSGQTWTTSLWYDGSQISNTYPLADLESFTFNVQVEVPPDVTPGISDTVVIEATSVNSPTITNTAVLQTYVHGDLAYVTVSDANVVALVDTATHTLLKNIDVGAEGCYHPWRAAMSPNRAYVYISCRSSASVAVIETANNTVVNTIYNIYDANGIAFTNDGNYALVGSRNSSQVAVINTNTYSITTYISTYYNPRSVVTHPYLDVAYVTTDAGAVQVIDTTTFSVTSQINFGSQLWDIEVSPDGQWVFVSDRWGAGLAVINANSNTIHTVINNLGDLNGLAVSPDGSQIYANSPGNVVYIIDGTTFNQINAIGISGAGWELAATCDGNNLYVSNAQYEVFVIDTNTQTIATQITMPNYGTRGIAICPPQAFPILSFEQTNYTVNETVGTATISLTLSKPSKWPVSVTYNTQDGSAIAWLDYEAISNTLTITPSHTSGTFNINIIDDFIVENDETLELRLSNPHQAVLSSLLYGSITTSPVTTTLTILGSQEIEVEFSQADYVVAENGNTALITVTLNTTASESISVDYTSSDGTATAGSDYQPISGTLSFAPGEVTQVFSLSITNDAFQDEDETIMLTLSNPTNATLGTQSSSLLTIGDDDTPLVQFSDMDYSANEGDGTATITVSLDITSTQAVTVEYATDDGTATAPDDYTSNSGILSFAPSTSTQSFTVAITDDSLVESDETVLLTLNTSSSNAILGSVSTATLTIVDDDDNTRLVQFSNANYTVDEGDGTATITVSLDMTSTDVVTVDYTTSNGTATADDYSSNSGTLTFAPGTLTQSFTVAITDDGLDEVDETIMLTLNTTSSNASLGSVATATLTIVDDDVPIIQFGQTSYEVNEDAGNAVLTVSINPAPIEPTTINYATSNGTATAGSDYVSSSGTLTFTTGTLNAAFVVAISDDAIIEGDETVILSLSDVSANASLASPTQATLTILDDDTGSAIYLPIVLK